MSLTKEQKNKLREANLKVGNAPVFKEAFHAQLREVNGANMRAVESIERDEDGLTEMRWRRSMDPEKVNSLMEDVIREISAEGELVTKEKVRSK